MMRTLRYPISGIVLILAACASTPAPTLTPPLPATAPSPTAARTATAAPTATNTPSPTDLPAPTATASPAPSRTPTATLEPTATATATTAQVDMAAWELPLITAGVTVIVIDKMETTAAGLRDGSLASIEAGIQLLGYQTVIGTVAQALEEHPLTGRATRYGDGLRANLRTVFGIITRWQAGELSSTTVGPELAAARSVSEQVLSELTDEMRQLGVSQARIDALMAEIDAP